MDTTRRTRRARARRADISLMVIGLLWIAGLWLISADAREVKNTWAVTEARIVDVTAETHTQADSRGSVRSSTTYNTEFSYSFQGAEYGGVSQDGADRSADIGTTMRVWVNPQSPSNFRHEPGEEAPVALYAIGALLFGCGAALMLKKRLTRLYEGADA